MEYRLGLTGADSSKNRIGNFKKVLDRLGKVDAYLEVGVCEGWSADWWLANTLKCSSSRYVGIDSWVDWDRHGVTGEEVRNSASKRLEKYGDRVELISGWSMEELPKLKPESFDLIYIDGNHDLVPVLMDSVLSWRLLKVGGVLLWDDYGQRSRGRQPKKAVQGFLSALSGRYDVLFENWQMAIVKTKHATEEWG